MGESLEVKENMIFGGSVSALIKGPERTVRRK